ncbi:MULTISPECIES: xylulokinase [Cobetia]|uniref:Xylulose kinase n=1 Tax=Cobetia crustatorum TaxID=553385 RepID=A0A558HHT6_9GAMM|nr:MULTISPECIES: xylulokinase [Cobetia]TVU68706.1 xylulokinase [Cobetia crustatorum]
MLVGVDCGTQSTKVVILDPALGRIVAQGQRSHELHEGANGRREQDPADWIRALEGAFDDALAAGQIDPQHIQAIGISGQQHGMVALGADGMPLYPAKLWCDTETSEHNAALIEALGGERGCLDALGLVLQTGYTASKVAWLREQHPELYQQIATLLLPHDYLNFWLTGERVTERGDASGTGYFDTRRQQWHQEIFHLIAPELDARRVLPRIIESHAPAGRIRSEIAARFGLREDVIVSSGGGDNMMSAIGTGNIAPGRVTLSMGTSGTVCAWSTDYPDGCDSQVASFSSSDGGWLPLVCTMNVTSATTRVREMFDLDITAFSAQVASSPRGAQGVQVLPFFNGERVPMLPRAEASFHGLDSRNTTPANLCRATMEGASYGLRYALECLGPLGANARQIRVVGGGAKSPLWRQMLADILNVEVVCPQVSEAAALGAAIQAAWCLGLQQGNEVTLNGLCERWVILDLSTRTLPEAAGVADYRSGYTRYRTLLEEVHGIAVGATVD